MTNIMILVLLLKEMTWLLLLITSIWQGGISSTEWSTTATSSLEHCCYFKFGALLLLQVWSTAATSSLCRWNQIFTKHEPTHIDIKFIPPKQAIKDITEEEHAVSQPPWRSSPTVVEKKAFIENMLTLIPSSAIHVTTWKVGPRINHTVSRQLPPTISSFSHPR